MKRMSVRIAIACLTFAVGVAATAMYLISRKSSMLPPPPDRTVYAVSYSELATNRERWVGKIVRVDALMFESPLSDPRLVNEKVPHNDMYYEFAPDAKEASAKWFDTFRPDVPDIPHEMTVCRRALVTITGEFLGSKIRVHGLDIMEKCPRLWFHDAYAPTPNKAMNRTRK